MQKNQNKSVILPESPEAARKMEVTLWVSREGLAYNDEEIARYAGCTHVKCRECGEIIEKIYTICDSCNEKIKQEKYLKLPKEKWDGETIFYSDKFNEYFGSIEELEDAINEENSEDKPWIKADAEEYRILKCVPVFPDCLNSDHWEDCYPDDSEEWEELEDLIADFNKKLSKIKPISYTYTRIALTF